MTFVLRTPAEQLCEQERYFSLHNNDFEEELYKGNFFLHEQNSITALSISSIAHCRRNSKKTGWGIRPSCI